MTRSEFESAARKQNVDASSKREAARKNGEACVIVDMLAFGGESYCTTHGVMGECPYGKAGSR